MNMDTVAHAVSLDQAKARAKIGIFFSGIVDQYHSHVLQAAIDSAREQGLNVVAYLGGELESPLPDHTHFNVIYRLATPRNMDALCLLTSLLMSYVDIPRMMTFCDQYAVPKISLGVELPAIPSILVDNKTGMRALVRHLIEVHGIRRIAFVRGPEHNPEAEERLQAYLSVLVEHHITFDPQLIVEGRFQPEDGKETISILLDQRQVEPDAIVAANDSMAIGALHELQRRHISVPDQIAVVGFDDIEDAPSTVPTLTTVRQPLYQQDKQGVKLAL